METEESLVEEQVRHYESRLRHIDELVDKARDGLQNHPERAQHEKTLAEILERRDALQVRLDDLKMNDPGSLAEELRHDGPIMGIVDAIAGDLEALVERLDG